MLDKQTVLKIACESTLHDGEPDVEIDYGGVRELATGWYVPFLDLSKNAGGTDGVMVNKHTGKKFPLSHSFYGEPVDIEADFQRYDWGYQFEVYFLIVTFVDDIERALDVLERLGINVVEFTYEYGVVWPDGRNLTREELRGRLEKLPCVFDRLRLRPHAHELERARSAGVMRFELLEYYYR